MTRYNLIENVDVSHARQTRRYGYDATVVSHDLKGDLNKRTLAVSRYECLWFSQRLQTRSAICIVEYNNGGRPDRPLMHQSTG